MRRTLDHLRQRIREELRAEGPDGAGYSDFFLKDTINSALDDLSEIFTIRDKVTLVAKDDLTTYDLKEELPRIQIEDIIRVEYDNKILQGISLDTYLDKKFPNEGEVIEWTLWGDTLILVGKVEEDKDISLWVTRSPCRLEYKDDIPDVPGYADEAIIQYSITACYRESKDYERANFHFGIYRHEKNNLLRRAVPQGQKDYLPRVRDSYWGVVRGREGISRSDTNPGGRR